jgi:hypothetical protein
MKAVSLLLMLTCLYFLHKNEQQAQWNKQMLFKKENVTSSLVHSPFALLSMDESHPH